MQSQPLKQLFAGKTRFLAPLVGGSDLAFRLLARKYGAQVTYIPMKVARGTLERLNRKRKPLAADASAADRLRHRVRHMEWEFHESDRPLLLQVAAPCDDVDNLIALVQRDEFRGRIDGVDLNCGCPQGFAMQRGLGAGMFRAGVDALTNTVRRLVQESPYPVSVKIRLHDDVDTTLEYLRSLAGLGVQAFTIHGRYYWQKGSNRGEADWAAIRRIRDEFPDLFIVGNGSVGRYEDIQRMLDATGVDAAMLGYGALVHPSVFQPEPESLSNVLSHYLTLACRTHNALVDVQRHVAWILKNHVESAVKPALFACQDVGQIVTYLSQLNPEWNIAVDVPPEQRLVAIPKQRQELEGKALRLYDARARREDRRRRRKAERRKRRREAEASAEAKQGGDDGKGIAVEAAMCDEDAPAPVAADEGAQGEERPSKK